MYDFPILSSSPIFDMLVKWLLEILFNLPFWTYLPFALFTMCSVSLLSFQENAALDSSLDFWFQSIFLTQKYLDRSIPRILMPVQVIWRMELLVHHEESNWSSWKLYHLLTFLLILDEEFRAPPQNQALVRLWHSHYHCNHKGGSTLDKLKEACAINAETERRQPCLGVPLAALLTTISIIPWLCCLVEFCVCMMMFVFMTLSDSLLCNDCWCIVGLLPTMTSVV